MVGTGRARALASGRGRRHGAAAADRPADPTGRSLREEELPMWRLPAPEGSCDEARTRSLWFGLVPTYSADHADVLRRPADPPRRVRTRARPSSTTSIYQLRCFARRTRPGHEHCPPIESLSEPTEPFRLAPFFDPDGTKNRTVSISMPDLRALAARAGRAARPGRGQDHHATRFAADLSRNGTTIPGGGSGTVGGDSPRSARSPSSCS